MRSLAHVVHSERGDARRRERLHLDAGGRCAGRARLNVQRVRLGPHLHLDGDVSECDRVAQRDEIRGALRRHDASKTGCSEHVALGVGAGRERRVCIPTKVHRRASNSSPLRVSLCGDVHHRRLARLINVRQHATRCGLAAAKRPRA